MKKAITKICFILLLLVFLLSQVCFATKASVWSGTSATAFESGTGTENDPYIIKTPEQLAYFASSVNSGTTYEGQYVSLSSNITLNDTTNWENWNTTAPSNSWLPIGFSSANAFEGVFDGCSHKISGIYINTTEKYQGLFGYVANGTVKNVGVEKSYISGGGTVGGIVGQGMLCTITLCYNTGTVSSTGTGTGGIAGYTQGTISKCFNDGNVTGAGNVGGITGSSIGSVSECYNAGSVSGTANGIGGIVGNNNQKDNVLSDCHNSGTVTGSRYVGGIAGNCAGSLNDSVSSCYNTGSVSSTYEKNGGSTGAILGVEANFVTDCYYTKGCAINGKNVIQYGIGTSGTSLADISGKTTGLSKEEMLIKESFSGFDFTDIWGIGGGFNSGYPYLRTLSSFYPFDAISAEDASTSEQVIFNITRNVDSSEGKIIAALYDGEALVNIKIYSPENSFKAEFDSGIKGNNIKFMWWNESIAKPLFSVNEADIH